MANRPGERFIPGMKNIFIAFLHNELALALLFRCNVKVRWYNRMVSHCANGKAVPFSRGLIREITFNEALNSKHSVTLKEKRKVFVLFC